MQNKKNSRSLLFGLATFMLVVLVVISIRVSAQNTTYPLVTLTPENDVSLVLQTQAVSYSGGKWTYNFAWRRTREAEGRLTIAPVANESNLVVDVDPAPREKLISAPLRVQLDHSTRYVVKFFSSPSSACFGSNQQSESECFVIRTVYFNTRNESGRVMATSEIPISRGGTMIETSQIGNQNDSDNSSIAGLQAQVNQLLALVQSLMVRLGQTTLISALAPTSTAPTFPTSTNNFLTVPPVSTSTLIVTNAPAGFACTGAITPAQSNIIATNSVTNPSQTTYNVATPAGNVTCVKIATGGQIDNRRELTPEEAGVYMWMKPNIFGYNGPRNAPEPIYVEVNGQDPFGAGNRDTPRLTTAGDVVVETYASVGRNFISGLFFSIPFTEACQNNSKLKIEVVRNNVPPGLNFSLGPDPRYPSFDHGACTYATLQGTPTTPGRYLFEYKITSNFGAQQIVRISKVYIIVKRTNVFPVNIVQNFGPSGAQVSNPEIGGRTLITWDQGGLRIGVTSFYRMDIWVAPGNQTGKNPDFITDKYLVATVQDDHLVCNSSTSGGSDPNLAWGCSRYNWLVGNTLGPNLTPGTYTIIVTPHIPVISTGSSGNFATNNEDMVRIMYKNSTDDGTAYAYGSTVVNITGDVRNLPSDNPGAYGDPSFMRGGISYVRKNQSGAVIDQGTVTFGRGQTLNINPTDSLELSWRAYFPASGSAGERDAGSAWNSGIRISNGVPNYENSTAQMLRSRTASAFPNIPGGFDFVETEGFMNSARGSYTISGSDMQELQGLGFSLRYTPNFYGCANLATFSNPGLANLQASSNTSVVLQQGATNCMLRTETSATLFVNVGVSDVNRELPLGNVNNNNLVTSAGPFNTDTCRLPDQRDMYSAVNPGVSIYTLQDGTNGGTGYNSYTTTFANLSLWNDRDGRPYRYSKAQFMVSTSREAVASGCTSGICIVNRQVSTVGSTGVGSASTSNRSGAQFVSGLEPNTVYYNRLVYTCDGVQGSRDVIWIAVTAGPGMLNNLLSSSSSGTSPSATGGAGNSASTTMPPAPVVLNTSCTVTGPSSFYAGWNDPILPSGVTFNPTTNPRDRIVFRSAAGSSWINNNGNWTRSNPADDTAAQTKISTGCPGVEDGSTNLATCLKNNNVTPGSNGATFYPIAGANPRTTYWNRVAYVKDFDLPTIRIVHEKVWSCNLP